MRNKDCIKVIHTACGQVAFKVLREHWRKFVIKENGVSLDPYKVEYPDGTHPDWKEKVHCGSCKETISEPQHITWKWTK